MKKTPTIRSLVTVLSGLLLLSACTESLPPYHQRVNPFIGTGGHGHTYPGATFSEWSS